jgi:hypothetical protein
MRDGCCLISSRRILWRFTLGGLLNRDPAFDLIEHDGDDLRDLPFLDCEAALARLLRDTEAGILFNEHIGAAGAEREVEQVIRNTARCG